MILKTDELNDNGGNSVAQIAYGESVTLHGLYRYVPQDRVWFLEFPDP